MEKINFEKTKEKSNFDGLVSAKDIIKMEFKKEDKWLIEKYLPTQGVLMISGDPKTFKTWLILYLAGCLADGHKIFETFQTKKCNVLIINEENAVRLLNERLRKLKIHNDNIFFYNLKGMKVDNPKDVKKIIEVINAHEIKLVVFDTFVRVHEKEENDASQMRTIFHSIKPILNSGASIIFTHHHRKEPGFSRNALRGSSEISAFINCQLLIQVKDKQDKTLLLKNVLNRDDQEQDDLAIRVDITEEDAKFEALIGKSAIEIKSSEQEKVILNLLKDNNIPLPIDTIKTHINLDIGDNKLRRLLNGLVRKNLLKIEKTKAGKIWYSTIDCDIPVS